MDTFSTWAIAIALIFAWSAFLVFVVTPVLDCVADWWDERQWRKSNRHLAEWFAAEDAKSVCPTCGDDPIGFCPDMRHG